MNGDLISREALIKELEQRHLDDVFIKRGLPPMRKMSLECNRALKTQGDAIRDVINDMPAVDAEPVRHGKWEKIRDSQMYDDYYCVYFDYECSNCGDVTNDRHNLPRYCPYCGAKMDADEHTQVAS